MEWEYKTINWAEWDSPDSPCWMQDFLDGYSQPQGLKIMGEKGWELASVNTRNVLSDDVTVKLTSFYFKRPLP
jgi:hypothetical protein